MIVTWKVHPEQYSKECGGVADTADNDSDDDDDDSLIIICFIYLFSLFRSMLVAQISDTD